VSVYIDAFVPLHAAMACKLVETQSERENKYIQEHVWILACKVVETESERKNTYIQEHVWILISTHCMITKM